MASPDRKTRIERPVTRQVLQRVADAGYPDLVHLGIRLAESPVRATDGAHLVDTALQVEAARLAAEAAVLQSLADLSDDTRWQSLLVPRAQELRDRAQANRKIADQRETFIKEHF